jgi:hypothetical protein
MNIAAQVATGNRKMVLENGPDVMNSDNDDPLEDVKPDEEKGMYTSEIDPKQGPKKLTQMQAAFQRAAEQALKAPKVRVRNHRRVRVQMMTIRVAQNGFGLKRKGACARTSITEAQRQLLKFQRRPTRLFRDHRHQLRGRPSAPRTSITEAQRHHLGASDAAEGTLRGSPA